MNEEIVYRVAQLLANGYTRKQCINQLLAGRIVNKPMTESGANKIVDQAYSMLDVDIGEDSKLNYSRLINLYQLCLDKRDLKTAQAVLKEIRAFNQNKSSDEEIVIKFVK